MVSDVILEISRAVVISVIFFYLVTFSWKKGFQKEKGWMLIIIGFALILFGSIIDITDNFTILDKFVLIGDTPYQAFLEKVVGYLFGFLFLAAGFLKWMPIIALYKETKDQLRKSNSELESKIRERTSELKKEMEKHKKVRRNLEKRNKELSAMSKIVTDRELKMIELKQEIKQLHK